MKKIYSIFLTAIAAFAFVPMTNAQTIREVIGYDLQFPKKDNHYDVEKNVAFSKQISKPVGNDGTYWIKLETFATGSASTVLTPADIVLVLDISSSMRNNNVQYTYRDEHRPRNSGWMYSDSYAPNNTIYYYEYNGTRCRVDHLRVYDATSATYGTGGAHYCLTFMDEEGKRHYMLNGNIYDTWEDVPKTDANDRDNDILWADRLQRWSGVTGQRRIDALRRAVKDFIDAIEINDKYEDAEGTRPRKKRIGNRISMITFAGANNATNGQIKLVNSLEEGALADASGSTPSTASYLKGLVDAFPEDRQGTRPDLGLALANEQLATITRESNKTVVVFTDGEPYPNTVNATTHPYGEGYDNAITAALQTKSQYGATVFSVGLFSDQPWEGDRFNYLWTFMNYLSSNAPNATDMSTPGTDYDKEAGYYKDASAENADLSAIFLDIARQSGGSANEKLTAGTSNVDIIAASFKLPENADKNSIKVFTAKCKTADNENHIYTFDTEVQAPNSDDKYDVYENGYWVREDFVDDYINVELDGLKITVTGFDYSNNWVGLKDDEPHGHEIIIMIPIQMNPDAVGGPNVATNVEGSGLYVPNQEEPEIEFTIPHVSLPVNLYIEKAGLKNGESAKFRIERAAIDEYVPEGEDVETWEWTPTDIPERAWTYVSTVFVTEGASAKRNPTADPVTGLNNPWVKVRGLPATITVVDEEGDPVVDEEGNELQEHIAYRIVEEKWSWSYVLDPEVDNNDMEQYTVPGRVDNPFKFTNKTVDERIDVTVRHAESKVTNHFTDKLTTKEVYDDSKPNTRTNNSSSSTESE